MQRAVLALGLVGIVAGWALDRTGAWGWAPELTDAPLLVGALLALAAAGLAGLAPDRSTRRVAARFAVVAPGRSLPVEVGAVPDPRTFSQATVGLDAGWLVPAPGVLVAGVAGGDALVGLGR